MKKYLAIVLSVVMMAAMTMTVCASTSPDKGNSSNVSDERYIRPSKSKGGSGGGSSSSSSSSSSTATTNTASANSSTTATKAAADAAVQQKVQPTQAVVVNGETVAANVSVASVPEEVNASFGIAAQYFTASPNAVITDTFSVNVAGLEGAAAPVSMVFSVENLPANFMVLVQDALGNWTCITPDLVVGNAMLLTIPATANIAIVTVPAV